MLTFGKIQVDLNVREQDTNSLLSSPSRKTSSRFAFRKQVLPDLPLDAQLIHTALQGKAPETVQARYNGSDSLDYFDMTTGDPADSYAYVTADVPAFDENKRLSFSLHSGQGNENSPAIWLQYRDELIKDLSPARLGGFTHNLYKLLASDEQQTPRETLKDLSNLVPRQFTTDHF